jgi:DNA-binding response OmpR family regulator
VVHLPKGEGSRLRILVVEDEMLIADMIADRLHDAGYEVVGPATSLARGKILASQEDLDLALLDINLAGNTSFAIAEILMQRRVPFAFLTGYGKSAIPGAYGEYPCLAKPFPLNDLVAIAERLVHKPRP